MSFCGVPRRKLPLAGSFIAPAGLAGAQLATAIAAAAKELLAGALPPLLQRRNSQSLVRKIRVLTCLAESFAGAGADLPIPAELCLKELYMAVHRAMALLRYCSGAGKLWLLLQNQRISGHFHDLNQEIATLLDVLLPLAGRQLAMPPELREQLQLLQKQCARSKVYADPRDEKLRRRLLSFLYGFERGAAEPPPPAELREVFIDGLGIHDAAACRAETEFMEELLYSHEEDDAADPGVLAGVIAVTRYCRIVLFGLDAGDLGPAKGGSFDDSELPAAVPKDFLCPISLDLMRDPVIAASGQTYDRDSIARWIEEGHRNCPNSGQKLAHARLVPNRALRSLISQWCAANGVPYAGTGDGFQEVAAAGKSAVEANRATARILVRHLASSSSSESMDAAAAAAALELRLLAKNGAANRTAIADAGAIPLLHPLLRSPNPAAQENSVTAILNLSIGETNKASIMEEEGLLSSIVEVLKSGSTEEARENAAAVLFSLSSVHDYKKRIAGDGAVAGLARLLVEGSSRGKRDAVAALFNLSTHPETGEMMVEGGAVAALVAGLVGGEVAEEAAGALAMLVRRRPAVAEEVGREGVEGLVRMMRRGSPAAKESAVAALSEVCRSGGAAMTRKVVANTPAIGGLIQMLLFTGTKRARRKAASLARLCQRCEAEAATATATASIAGWRRGEGEDRSQRELPRSSSSVGRASGAAAAAAAAAAAGDVQAGISVPVL